MKTREKPRAALVPLVRAAGILGVSPATLRRWLATGEGGLTRAILGRNHYVTRISLDAVCESGTPVPAPERE